MKEQILETATELFNHNGIDSVSLRSIAAAIGISDGHLRYYFKTKEDLLAALFRRLEEAISRQIPPQELLFNPEALTFSLYASFDFLYASRFFFQSSPTIYQKYPLLMEHLNNMRRVSKEQLLSILKNFRENGLLKPEVTENELEIIFEQFFIISDNFVKYVNIGFYGSTEEEAKEAFMRICLSLFVPYCTDTYSVLFKNRLGLND